MSTKESIFGLKGNIVYSIVPEKMEVRENSYLVCERNEIKGVYETLHRSIRIFRSRITATG